MNKNQFSLIDSFYEKQCDAKKEFVQYYHLWKIINVGNLTLCQIK